ncbi:MAG: class I SAM-dependent methyltransferase [Planctomycetes bacterium]|nr:class I SAM-dependent methyltransferase [Planctomycetota bacterium]
MKQAAAPQAAPPTSLGFIDRAARNVLTRQLAELHRGEIILESAGETQRLGEAGDLQTTLQVHQPRFFRQTLLGGSLSVAETYLRGEWDCDDLTTLFRIFIRNMDKADDMDSGWVKLASRGHRLFHWWHANTRDGSRRNIHEHYDLGNNFFRLWLDDTMAYSSGIFPRPGATLRDASVEKIDRACRKLGLTADDHLVEIGTGWGGLAIHAASQYGCRVTTTTISQEQYAVARERVDAAGLSDRITLLQQDYRDLRGTYDRLVSIEMIEAVGFKYFDDYFRKCGELLTPEGSLVIQAIVMPERRYPPYLKGVDFIQRYVFPGGCLPSMAAMLESVGRTTDLRFVHAEDFAPHYAETLRRWKQTFHARIDEVRQQGYSEEFIRLWNYYLCYCEAVFEERYVGVIQIQFDKPLCRRDPVELSRRAAGLPA